MGNPPPCVLVLLMLAGWLSFTFVWLVEQSLFQRVLQIKYNKVLGQPSMEFDAAPRRLCLSGGSGCVQLFGPGGSQSVLHKHPPEIRNISETPPIPPPSILPLRLTFTLLCCICMIDQSVDLGCGTRQGSRRALFQSMLLYFRRGGLGARRCPPQHLSTGRSRAFARASVYRESVGERQGFHHDLEVFWWIMTGYPPPKT